MSFGYSRQSARNDLTTTLHQLAMNHFFKHHLKAILFTQSCLRTMATQHCWKVLDCPHNSKWKQWMLVIWSSLHSWYITLRSGLDLDKNISSISAACFYWLNQLQSVWKWLDTKSVVITVHVLVMCDDYCKFATPCWLLKRAKYALNTAACIVYRMRRLTVTLTMCHKEI